ELEDWQGVIDDGKKALEAYKTAKIDLMKGSVLVTIFQAALKLGQEEEVNRAYQGMLELSQKDDRLIYQRNLQEAKYELAQRKGQYAQALTFYQSYIILRDSIKDEKNLRALLDQQYKYEYIQKAFQDSVAIEQQNALDQLKLENQVQTRNFGLVGSLLLVLGVGWIAWVQYQSRRQKQRLADEIQAKNEALVRTQDQLILQEKMASLGQMATGIAHEIKNPLNFIKNFAEGTTDLTEELSEEIIPHMAAVSEEKQAAVQELLELIDKHAGIIQEQGARADAIVVRMMSHASNKRREKTATAINPLIEDSLLLAYHGFKPQNEGLDIRIEKQFDVIFTPIVLHAQDIGRVIINLINNACYALDQKATAAGSDFQPILRITSHKSEKFVSVRIWDNGVGIAAEVKGQIFQPFFTTKPRGEGNVGLGLSISYDIVTEGHQGTLTVKSEEGKYTQFKIQLPIIEG
ncbi:MAG: ATP-binding protein, partial [Bacteroidota bacterium]